MCQFEIIEYSWKVILEDILHSRLTFFPGSKHFIGYDSLIILQSNKIVWNTNQRIGQTHIPEVGSCV
jgi:hypothetical protein